MRRCGDEWAVSVRLEFMRNVGDEGYGLGTKATPAPTASSPDSRLPRGRIQHRDQNMTGVYGGGMRLVSLTEMRYLS